MVIDTSAIIAILRLEPDADALLHAIAMSETCTMSSVSLLEASMVLMGSGRSGQSTWPPLDALVSQAGVEIVAFDEEQAIVARDAFARYGKGRHKAALNLGDCVSYALARVTPQPLLFKGGDFALTDVRTA